ncbi:hypothetical protein Vretimale_6761, partial [Volvox reticuliferus]
MPAILRLRWLRPGYSFAPVLAVNAYELLKVPSDVLFRICTIWLSPGCFHTSGAHDAASRSCHTSASSAASSSSCFDTNTDARAAETPPTVHPNSFSSQATAPTRSLVSPPGPLELPTATQPTGSQSMPLVNPVPGISSAARTKKDLNRMLVGRGDDGDCNDSSHGNDGGSGGSGGGDDGDDGWNRLGGFRRRARYHRYGHQDGTQDGTQDGKALTELAAKMRRLRESLGQLRDTANTETVAERERSGGGSGGSQGGGDSNTVRGTGRCEPLVNGAVSSRAADPQVLHGRRAPAASGATAVAATAASGTWMQCGGAGDGGGADDASLGTATRGAAAAAVAAERAAAEWDGDGLWNVANGINVITTPTAASPARNSGDEGDAARSTAAAPSGVDAVAGASDGNSGGGGSGGYVRVIQGGGGSMAAAAAAANRDADLMRRILELRDLREAELLVYNAGSYFRSVHAGEMLVRLPELDLETSNSGMRTRRLIRFLSQCALRDLQPLPGPLLARCVAAFARLSYAPPETVAPLAAALTAQSARKLRACSGREVADLAWALACLEGLYGEMHQAVRQPARAARLAAGVRVV